MRLASTLAGAALYSAASVWVFYIALEPHVRRAWPECLISWARLLSGRILDPIVGRDVLFGIAAYQGLALGTLAILAVAAPGGFEGPGVTTGLAPLVGTRFFLAALADAPRNGVTLGTFYLLVLLLVRTLVRGRRFLLSRFGSRSSASSSPTSASFRARRGPCCRCSSRRSMPQARTVILIRLGLLPMVVIASLFDLAVSICLTFDLEAWYVGQTLWAVAIVLALAVWAYHTSQRAGPSTVLAR